MLYCESEVEGASLDYGGVLGCGGARPLPFGARGETDPMGLL